MLEEKLHAFIKDYGFERTYWLAYSGGLDSRVLLQLAAQLKKRCSLKLRAIHVHHGLSPHADRWAEHCARSCEQAGVDLVCRRIDARPPAGESLEAYARAGRYAVFKEILGPDDILLTAHHQDDQAETVLLQLLRGAGPKGLSAMPPFKPLGQGWLARPLLTVSRTDLKAYAEEEALLWVEDESNADLDYPRNFLRHELLPLIHKQWPAAATMLARSAEHCAETQNLLAVYADQDLARLVGSKPGTLTVSGLLDLTPARQRLILRRWFELRGVKMPSALKLQEIQEAVLQASWDARPCVAWGQIELRRYQDQLYLLSPLNPHQPERVYHWDLNSALVLDGIGNLQASKKRGQGWRTEFQPVEVRFRRGGEVYRLPNGQHHELKKFFQEQGIPPWERDRLPLIFLKDELLAVPGYLLVEQFRAAPGEEGLVVSSFQEETPT